MRQTVTYGVLRAVYYALYRAYIARVLRLYLPRIMRVSCAVVYYACIGVNRCVSVCYHLPDTYYLGRPGRNTCITLYDARIDAYQRVFGAIHDASLIRR